MKIAIASSGLGHIARGVEAWAADTAAGLAARGCDVSLYKGGGTAEQPYETVLRCWQRERPAARWAGRLTSRPGLWRLGYGSPYSAEQRTFARSLVAALRRRPADVLHVQDPVVALELEAARHQAMITARTVLGHGTTEAPELLARLRYVHELTPWALDQARAAGNAKPTWAALPNFIDTTRFAPGGRELRRELGLAESALVVLCVAAIKRTHKRIDYLVDEFAALRGRCPDLPAYLVVAGGWEPETEALVAESESCLGDRVRFLIRFPRERIPALYRAADVYCLCSEFEIFGIATIEAAASGLPCLVHDHPVSAHVIGPGGRTIDMTRPGALADSLAELLADEALRRSLGRAAREHCVAHFDREAVLSRYLEYYERVLADGAGQAAP